MDEYGPLTKKVIEYQDTVRGLVTTVKSPEDWAPLGELLAIDEFERTGPFLDVQDWPQYAEMVNGWAQGVQSFETTVRRVAELPRRVYLEVEERHLYGNDWLVVNSMNVFEFNDEGKVCRLDVYLQSPPTTG
ncbi:hypothetical protein JDV09_25565 [Mycobacterium sp. Y57]|uniref:hypothetical protein n=1 Tax=Mycolicibacterium xanthum TaxID=2796469 RepID=UPI001C850E7A|nr:hypothetical protein [Mycolicibacterium xanthum]MBX7435436.1 hypothetical protein [Mycolicibacterium xanthum]